MTPACRPCVVENDYTFPMVTHFAIEPHAFLAAPDPEGVTIWSPIQHPFVLQRVVAAALRLAGVARPHHRAGSGRGLRRKGLAEVRAVDGVSRAQDRTSRSPGVDAGGDISAVRRTSARTHVRSGFDRSGRIVFQDIQADFMIGAYADIGARVVSKASYAACGPYRTPHARVTARALLSHTTPSTAFRGFGTPQASWAVESQLNEAADIWGSTRRDPASQCGREGRSFHPERYAGRWRLAQIALTNAAAQSAGMNHW